MKTKNILLALLFAGLVGSSTAQSYSVDWHKISGGGGTSTGGNFSVIGTIGQHDATASSALTGGGYSLTSGFWSLYAVQTPGAPWLKIYLSGTASAVVAWPVPGSAGFVLQENLNLATTNWVNSSATISTSNNTNQITVSPPAGNKFFRLYHP
jgi:hypothetical protein